MATSLFEIEEILREEGLKYVLLEDHIRTSYATDSYSDPDGQGSVFLVLKPEERGEYFKLIAPNLYSYPSGPNEAAVFRTLLSISWRTKLVQFEYDERDGEIRAIVEFPLEDARLSRRQLLRCLNGMVQIIDDYHAEVMDAILFGRLSRYMAGGADLKRLAQEYYGFIGRRPQARAARVVLEE
jgi:hypothetical protein